GQNIRSKGGYRHSTAYDKKKWQMAVTVLDSRNQSIEARLPACGAVLGVLCARRVFVGPPNHAIRRCVGSLRSSTRNQMPMVSIGATGTDRASVNVMLDDQCDTRELPH